MTLLAVALVARFHQSVAMLFASPPAIVQALPPLSVSVTVGAVPVAPWLWTQR